MMYESNHLAQGSNQGYKRRAPSPPEPESRRQRHRGPRAPEQDKRRTSRSNRRTSSNQTAGFRAGAGESLDLSACAICLSRAPHNIRYCNVTTRWDGKPALYSRNEDFRIVDKRGNLICSDWQRPDGCNTKGHRHECSGCGSLSHGAQECSFTQPRNRDPASL